MANDPGYGAGRQVRVIDHGRVELTCAHDVPGVTPQMILWYFTHRTKDRYQVWHPAHQDFKVIYQSPRGHIGSIYYIKEQFENGPLLETKLLVVEASDQVFAEKNVSWNSPGSITHRFAPIPGGTHVSSRGVLGSDLPLVGDLWNFWRHRFELTPPALKGIFAHMDEEFQNFSKFLPAMYNARTEKD
jgi:hypothetical protein